MNPLLLALLVGIWLPVKLTAGVADGDAAYRHRDVESKAREALSHYRTAVENKPGNSEWLWRLSMACHFVGMRYTANEDDKRILFKEGAVAGKGCVQFAPQEAACHFWTAINLALYGQVMSPFRTLNLLPEIRKRLETTLQLDAGYAFGGAARVLGLIDQKLPGILGGSNKQARRHFESAILSAPDEPMNYLLLAKLLKDEFEEPGNALLVAKRGALLPKLPLDRIEGREAAEELKDLIRDWEPQENSKVSCTGKAREMGLADRLSLPSCLPSAATSSS